MPTASPASPQSSRTPRVAWLADPSALELHAAYVQARERVAAIPDDTGAAPAMTAATIGEQRTEVLSKRG